MMVSPWMMYTNEDGNSHLRGASPVLPPRMNAKNNPAVEYGQGTKPGHNATATALKSKPWENPSISR